MIDKIVWLYTISKMKCTNEEIYTKMSLICWANLRWLACPVSNFTALVRSFSTWVAAFFIASLEVSADDMKTTKELKDGTRHRQYIPAGSKKNLKSVASHNFCQWHVAGAIQLIATCFKTMCQFSHNNIYCLWFHCLKFHNDPLNHTFKSQDTSLYR